MRSLRFQLALGIVLLSSVAVAQVPAVDLVREVTKTELDPPHADVKYMFQVRRQTPRGSQTKVYVQTSEAVAGLVVSNDDRPLTPEERKGEMWRVRRFIKDAGEMKKKQKQEKEDAERAQRIMKALPDAFLYEYDGTEAYKSEPGETAQPLTRLKFTPNPKYDPPSRVEQLLTGIQGHLLIDPKHHRMARIQGTLFQEVSFGWGILGHLDKGGHITIEQQDVGGDHWEITRMDLNFTGKILLFKSINVQFSDAYSNFRPVSPDLTFAQGIDLLAKEEALVAENLRRNGANK